MRLLIGLLLALILLITLAAAAVLVAGRMGFLQGQAPTDLGVREGRLKPPSATENSVSSQAGLYPTAPMRAYAEIAPLALRGDGPATIARLRSLVEATPGAVVVEARPDYLYARFQSRWLGFVDDVEFWFDPAAERIELRSASRLGRRDLGVNRARIEALRAALAAAP
jgi:uncharacterized protein (DUF1499 family)